MYENKQFHCVLTMNWRVFRANFSCVRTPTNCILRMNRKEAVNERLFNTQKKKQIFYSRIHNEMKGESEKHVC